MPENEENKVPTIRQYPLERAKILKKFIASEILYLILFGFAALIAVVAYIFYGAGLGLALLALGIIIFIIISIVNFWYQTEYYNKYYYDLRQNFLVIKKGVFMPRETTLPFGKLQDVYLDQDIFDRIFGLWDLHVSTATSMSGAEAHIDGVTLKNGEIMRELLLAKIKEKK